MISIRPMIEDDIVNVSLIHAECFPRQLLSSEWITCNFRAKPKIRYFVAEYKGNIAGYIQWTEKSGFRKEVILELEQMAVIPKMQKQGIGTALIMQSLPMIKVDLAQRNAMVKHIVVTTRTDNESQKLYLKTLHAKSEAIVTNLFSADEVFMIARNIKI